MALAVAALSPVNMTTRDAAFLERGNRLTRSLPQRVGNEDDTSELAVYRDMHRGTTGLCDRSVDRHPSLKQQRRIAHQHDPAVDGCLDARACNCSKVCGSGT